MHICIIKFWRCHRSVLCVSFASMFEFWLLVDRFVHKLRKKLKSCHFSIFSSHVFKLICSRGLARRWLPRRARPSAGGQRTRSAPQKICHLDVVSRISCPFQLYSRYHFLIHYREDYICERARLFCFPPQRSPATVPVGGSRGEWWYLKHFQYCRQVRKSS